MAAQAPPKRPPEIVDLVGRARAAPPEFAADALLRLAESRKVTDRAWKQELLEEAFRLAANAQQPMRRKLVAGSGETRATFLSHAFDFSFDALSLQGRAVQAMLRVDKRKARELFAEIPPPQLPAVTCEDALVPHLADFYETLGNVAENAFDPEEKREDKHVRWVEGYVANMVSPVQIGPVAHLILFLKTARPQLEILLLAFSTALERMDGDNRTFSADINGRVSLYSLAQLLSACRRHGIPEQGLLLAFRKYLVKHLSGSQCADSSKESRAYYLENFNKRLRLGDIVPLVERVTASSKTDHVTPSLGEIPPITEKEATPSKTEAAARSYTYWNSLDTKNLLAKVRQLRARPRKVTAAAGKEDVEWHAEVSQFLNGLEGWRASQEPSEADYFHQKSMLFFELLEALPPGGTRSNVLESFMTFLGQSNMQQESRIEWYWHANTLVNKIRSSKPEERSEISAALVNTRNAVLLLYQDLFAELEPLR